MNQFAGARSLKSRTRKTKANPTRLKGLTQQTNHFTAYDLGDIYPFCVYKPNEPVTLADLAAQLDSDVTLLAKVNELTPKDMVSKVD